MTLGELLALARREEPEKGTIVGQCMVCQRGTEHGFRGRDTVSDSFSGWNKWLAGDCVCPSCRYLFRDQVFRKKSWVASAGVFRTFSGQEDREARLRAILEPPEPPFFIYVARVGHRQSWLSCLHRVASNREQYFMAHEDYDIPIAVNRARAVEYVNLIRAAQESLKVTKTELHTGEFRPGTWRRALEAGQEGLLKTLSTRKGDILWEVIVYVA